MVKLNFAALKRPAKTVRAFSYSDENFPEPLTMTLHQLDALEEQKTLERADYLIARFIKGGFIGEDNKWHDAPQEFPLIGEETVSASERAFRLIARIETMQTVEKESDRYLFMELVTLSVCSPPAWEALIDAAVSVQSGDAGKALADPSNGPPISLPATESSTPNP